MLCFKRENIMFAFKASYARIIECVVYMFWMYAAATLWPLVARQLRVRRWMQPLQALSWTYNTLSFPQTKSFYMSVKMAQVFRCTLQRAILGNDAIFLWHFREPNCRCYWWGESSLGHICTRRGSDASLTQPQLLVQRSYINTARPREDKVGHSLHIWTSASPHFLSIRTCISCIY